MAAVITVLIVLTISLVVIRVASVALMLTGVSDELAKFQAHSAFTGVGFTTTESEDVVRHPLRRRIIMTLMLFGQAGVVTAVASLVLTFVNTDQTPSVWWGSPWGRLASLVVGAALIVRLAYTKHVDRWLSRSIRRALTRFVDLELRDYTELFHLAGDYAVSELKVKADDWVADRTLRKLELASEGVLVLGIERGDGNYVGAPKGDTRILAGDQLILYGRTERLHELERRPDGFDGNLQHIIAVDSEIEVVEEQKRLEDPLIEDPERQVS